MKKSIRQNLALLIIAFLSIVFFSHILYLGGNRLYRMEANWRHGVATARLHYGKEIIISALSDYSNHLAFLSGLSEVRKLVDGSGNRIALIEQVADLLEQHADAFEKFDRVSLLNAQGNIGVSIRNGRQVGIDSPGKQRSVELKTGEDEKTTKKPENQAPDQATDVGKDSQVLDFRKPLARADGTIYGWIRAELKLSTIFNLLPENVFIQDDTGLLMKPARDGSIIFKKSPYDFSGSGGMLEISRTETIHHEPIEIIPGRTVTLAMIHRHADLAGTLSKLLLLSGILLTVFISLVILVSAIILRKFSERVRTQKAIISSLVEMTDWRDPETGGHLIRTQTYAIELARQLRKSPKYRRIITEEFIENFHDAVPLHDIGKVGIPDAILLKPGKLTDDEFAEMKKHTRIGGKLLKDMIDDFGLKEPFIIMARNIALSHHEKFDGTGYPLGLSGGKIPFEAKIFALADVYDALRSERPYKEEISHEDAIAIIRQDSGTHFDPDIVEALYVIEARFKQISRTT